MTMMIESFYPWKYRCCRQTRHGFSAVGVMYKKLDIMVLLGRNLLVKHMLKWC